MDRDREKRGKRETKVDVRKRESKIVKFSI